VNLAAFAPPFNYDSYSIEKFAAGMCRRGELEVEIDHETNSFIFKNLDAYENCSAIRTLQGQLNAFADRLRNAIEASDPSITTAREAEKQQKFADGFAALVEERELTVERRRRIERNLEAREEMAARTELERQQRIIELQQAEEARLAEREKSKAAERLEQQRKEIERAEELKVAQSLVKELRDKNIKIAPEVFKIYSGYQ
jgi:translation initiation factor 3 subunit A